MRERENDERYLLLLWRIDTRALAWRPISTNRNTSTSTSSRCHVNRRSAVTAIHRRHARVNGWGAISANGGGFRRLRVRTEGREEEGRKRTGKHKERNGWNEKGSEGEKKGKKRE